MLLSPSALFPFPIRLRFMGNSASEDSSSISSGDDDDENRTTHDDTKETTTAKQSDEGDEEDTSDDDYMTKYASSTESVDADDNVWHPPDFDSLYSKATLTGLLSSIPNNVKSSQISTQESALLRYLENRHSRGETAINKDQFCEVVVNWGLSKEESERCFSLFDTEGRQEIDIASAVRRLRAGSLDFTTLDNDLPCSVQILQRSSLMPGFADIRSNGTDPKSYERNLGSFMNQTKLQAEALPWIPDVSVDSVFRIRKYIVDHWINSEKFHAFLESSSSEQGIDTKVFGTTGATWAQHRTMKGNSGGTSGNMPSGAKLLKRCYDDIYVSSNKKDAKKLIDGDMSTYWQSDGTAGCHYIEILLKKNVIVTNLSIGVSSADKNFMPSVITISVSRASGGFHQFPSPPAEIPSFYHGSYKLKFNPRHAYRRLRINIKRCHGNGCDTRVRGIEIEGYRKPDEEEHKSLPLEEAGILWYLNILTSTVEACIPIAPALRRMIIDHTMSFTNRLSPLSLTGCEEVETSLGRGGVLTPTILEAAEKSLERMLSDSGSDVSADAVKILASFTLAHPNYNSVIRVVRYLLNLDSPLPSEVTEPLKQTMKSAVTSLLMLHATKLPCLEVSANGPTPGGFGSRFSESLCKSHSGEGVLDVVWKPPNDCTTMIVTRIVITFPTSATAPRSGSVYALSCEQEVVERLMKNQEDATKFMSSLQESFADMKQIGSFSLQSEESPSEVELLLEPCPCRFILLHLQDPVDPEKANNVAFEKAALYGFSNAEGKTAKPWPYLPLGWKDVDESNPNAALACHLLVFANTVYALAYDFDMGSLAFGLSTCTTPFDMDQLFSCFTSVFGDKADQTALKLIFLQFMASLFRRSASLEVQECQPSNLRHIWESLVALSTGEHKSVANAEYAPKASMVSAWTVDIISNGITIFYPSETDRKNGLLSLLSEWDIRRNQVISKTTFAALCKCFAGSESSRLIALPYGHCVEEEDLESIKAKVRDVFHQLYVGYIGCLRHDFKSQANKEGLPTATDSSAIGSVISAQHLRLFAWYSYQKKEIQSTKTVGEQTKGRLLASFDEMVTHLLVLSLRSLRKLFSDLQTEIQEDILLEVLSKPSGSARGCKALGSGFSSLYQMAASVLGASTKADIGQVLDEWMCLMTNERLKNVIASSLSEAANEKKRQLIAEEKELTTLARWTNVASSHPYDCPSHIQRLFRQPGAVVFEIEVTSANCKLDNKDYVLFVSDRGRKVMLKNKKTWPRHFSIQSRDQLQFVFHSEIRTSSVKYWGYQFTITAKGIPTPVLSTWSSDLFCTLSQFGGHLFSLALQASDTDGQPMNANAKSGTAGILGIGMEFIRQCRQVDECNRLGASLATVTFLRPSLDVIANMNSARGNNGMQNDLSNALIKFWSEIITCKEELATDSDRRAWLFYVLHLFPWRSLNSTAMFDSSNELQPERIVKLIFETALSQQELARRKAIELKEELIDASCYGTFRDWLAIIRSGNVDNSQTISESQFRMWRQVQFGTEDLAEKRRAKLFVSQYADVLKRRIICDGCGQAVEGIRYHCLDCVDIDLCAVCLSFGDGPICHANDHRLVAFSFKCNGCGGYIIGSRFHCSVCKDFDLCFGCMLNSMRPEDDGDEEKSTEHKREHAYVSFPPTCVREDEAERQLVSQYLAHYAWLSATRLALRLFSDECSASEWTTVFSSEMIELVKTHFLVKPVAVDQSKIESSDSYIWNNRMASAEQANSERLLGLIALTSDLAGVKWPQLHDAIVLVYRILKSECGESRSLSDHLALYVLGKLCIVAGPEVSDHALNECSRTPVQGCEAGYLTLQFLFIFGSSCLTTIQLQWSSAVAWIWSKFLTDAAWSAVAGRYLQMKMVANESTQSIETVYAYLIFTGFPGTLSRGAEVEYMDGKGRRQHGVMVEVVGERGLFKILAPQGRRLHFVRAKDINHCIESSFGDTSKVIGLVDLISNCQIAVTNVWDEGESNGAWSNVGYELLLGAALSMKALSVELEKKRDTAENLEELFASFFCQDLIRIASQATTLPLGTRTSMVENFMIQLLDSSVETFGFRSHIDPDDDIDDGEFGSEYLRGLAGVVRALIRELHREFNVPVSLLRAIYDVKRGDTASLLYEVRRQCCTRGGAAPLSQDIVFRAACLERSAIAKRTWQRHKKQPVGPTDKGISPLPLVSERLSDATRLEMSLIDEEEFSPSEVSASLKEWGPSGLVDSASDKDSDQDRAAAKYVAQMAFQSHLQNEGQTRAALLRRVSSALAVLFARKLLAQLMARWPKSVSFDDQHFGLENHWQLLNVLDMFSVTPDCRQDAARALSVVFDRCPQNMIRPLAYACCQLLQEGIDETKRGKMTGQLAKEVISIPKASSVRIFANVSYGGGNLTFEYIDDKDRSRTLRQSDFPVDVVLNTNEVSIEFSRIRYSVDDLTWKIVGKNFRYFDTGYKMLRLILNAMRHDETIRGGPSVDHLWVWLLYLCCRTMGHQRLKVIDLLTRLVSTLESQRSGDSTLPIELRLAVPLWKLLSDLNLICASRRLNYLPETGRSLAQFFYVLEGLARKWNVEDKFSFSMCDSKPAIRSYAHGCRIVANVCAGIGIENEMTALMQAMAEAVSKKNQDKGADTTMDLEEDKEEESADSDDGRLSDLTFTTGDDGDSDAENESFGSDEV